MTVARITEISSISSKSFEDAITQGVARANQTLKNVKGAWVKDQEVTIDNGKVTGYKVILKVTFVLEEKSTAIPAFVPAHSPRFGGTPKTTSLAVRPPDAQISGPVTSGGWRARPGNDRMPPGMLTACAVKFPEQR